MTNLNHRTLGGCQIYVVHKINVVVVVVVVVKHVYIYRFQEEDR